jgi:hypothetical protein
LLKCEVKREQRKGNRMCQNSELSHMAKAIETKAKNIFFFYLLFFGYFDAFNSRGEGFVFWKTSRVAERKWLKKKKKNVVRE